jgi:hypothetical protein
MKDDMNDIVAQKPWITESESQDVTDKIDDFLGKVAALVAKQEEAGLAEDATFKVSNVESDFAKVQKLYKKVSGKKKPVEKKSKKEEKKDDEEFDESDSKEHHKEEDL